MAPTACSICAAPSVPEGSDMCPRCRRNFVDERVVGTSVTATRAGGLTGAVTARPGPVVAALLLTAAAWFLRYLDLIAPVGDPVWLLALPAVAVASAGCVMAAVGPAKHLPVVVGLLGALAALLWPTGRPLVDGAYGAAGLGLVVATVSEPSGFRLMSGAALVAGCAALGLGSLFSGANAREARDAVLLEHQGLGVRWTLPAGWRQVDRLDVLSPPPASAAPAVLLVSNEGTLTAMAVFDRAPGREVCAEVLSPFPGLVRGIEEPGGPFPAGTRLVEAGSVMAACSSLREGPVVALVVHSTGSPALLPVTMRVLAAQFVVTTPPQR